MRAVVVTDEPELLALPHPTEHDLHLPLARQASEPDILRTMESKHRSCPLFVGGKHSVEQVACVMGEGQRTCSWAIVRIGRWQC